MSISIQVIKRILNNFIPMHSAVLDIAGIAEMISKDNQKAIDMIRIYV